MDRRAARTIAENDVEQTRIERKKFKISKVEYRRSADTWIVAYAERGKWRVIGDDFVVLVDDDSKQPSLFEGMAYGRQRLEEQIARIILEKAEPE